MTIPLIFQDLFTAAGADVRDYLPIQRLDPIGRFVWRDGTTFDLRADGGARLAEIAHFAPGDVEGFKRLLRKGESIWNLSADTFLSHAPEQLIADDAADQVHAMTCRDESRRDRLHLREQAWRDHAGVVNRH